MRVNIYYGGRGLVDDPTLFAMEKVSQVLDELHVKVERYNLYEEKNNISVLPQTLKEADGVILAASLEWFGIGSFMQQFLDSCWLYGDKEKLSKMYMLPIVVSTTYGEREVEYSLIRAWEMLGGIPCEGLCAYVENHVEFETNATYAYMIEKKAEDFYRVIAKKTAAFPSSSNAVKQSVLRSHSLSLTPQESEQLSIYVSDDTYVKKQKEDIEELTSLFQGMLGDDNEDKFIVELKHHFQPNSELKAVFQIDIADRNQSLILDIKGTDLNCYYGTAKKPDVIAKTKATVMEQIVSGERTFQSAFMSGDLSAQGNFKILRNFDTIFCF